MGESGAGPKPRLCRGVQDRLKSQRVETVTDAAKHCPRSRLCELRNIPEAEKPLRCDCPAYRMCKDSSMFELVIAAIALSSATIFLAHAVEAFLTQ
jgi:hypothetical protein